jgi:hypothetical protein
MPACPKYFALIWIGFAAASGKLIDVPIIIQQLVKTQQRDGLITFETMLTLDAGNHPNYRTGTVRQYQADWWTKGEPPQTTVILSLANVAECLEFHRKERALSKVADNTYSGTQPHSGTHASMSGTDTSVKDLCVSYRKAAVHALHDLRHLRLQIKDKEVALENKRLLTMRRASAFNQLFEVAVVKDASESAAAPPPPAPATQPTEASTSKEQRVLRDRSKAKHGKNVPAIPKTLTNKQLANILREHAAAELDRHPQHPSDKWTWGVDLELADIRELFRAAERDLEPPHSGYDESLTEGSLVGKSSSAEPMPQSGFFSGIEDVDMPELSDSDMPAHFHYFPLHRPRTAVIDGTLPTGGNVPSPTASDLAFRLANFNIDNEVLGTGMATTQVQRASPSSSNHGADVLRALASSSSSDAGGDDVLRAIASSSSSDAGGADVLRALASSSSSDAGGADVLRALASSSSSDAGGADVLGELASSSSSDAGGADVLQALASSSSSDAGGADVLQALASSSSSSSSSSSNPGADILRALVSSSSSNSSSDPAPDILQAMASLSSDDGGSGDDLEGSDELMPVPVSQENMWTAADFAGYPDPDDCTAD